MSVAAESLLRLYPALAGLPAADSERLLAAVRTLVLPAGAPVFERGQAAAGFPLVLDGMVRVVRSGERGRELVLYRVTPGEGCILTSGCLLADAPYSADAVAEQDTTVALVPRAEFDLLLAHPPFRGFVFGLFANRLAELTELVDAVAFRRLDARLATRLLGHGPVLGVTHQQLADELGTVREIVSRVLKHFEERGLVRLGRQRIEILDPPALRAVAVSADDAAARAGAPGLGNLGH